MSALAKKAVRVATMFHESDVARWEQEREAYEDALEQGGALVDELVAALSEVSRREHAPRCYAARLCGCHVAVARAALAKARGDA